MEYGDEIKVSKRPQINLLLSTVNRSYVMRATSKECWTSPSTREKTSFLHLFTECTGFRLIPSPPRPQLTSGLRVSDSRISDVG